MENYEETRDAAMERTQTTRIQAVAMKGATKLIARRKYKGFCVPILCYAPPCPCMGGPIIWIPAEEIIGEKESDNKTSEGHDILDIDVLVNAELIVEKPVRMMASSLTAIQTRGKVCDKQPPNSISKKVGAAEAVKASFLAGYAIGTWLDDQFDGGLSDKGADIIEDIVSWFD